MAHNSISGGVGYDGPDGDGLVLQVRFDHFDLASLKRESLTHWASSLMPRTIFKGVCFFMLIVFVELLLKPVFGPGVNKI